MITSMNTSKREPSKHLKNTDMILDYLTTETEITIITKDGEHTYPMKDYYNFLRRNDKLDWELNLSDDRGEHVQSTGLMSMEEYWNTSHTYILLDLEEFLVSKQGDQWTSNVIGKILNKAI
jgi:hypothetical protein